MNVWKGMWDRRRWQAFRALPRPIRLRFLLMVLPWLAALLAGFPILWSAFSAVTEAPQWRAQETLVAESIEILRRTVDSLQHDVTFLSDLSVQLPRSDISKDAPISKLFLSFARSAGAYDLVRWLDETGDERLRVNAHDGNPVLVPKEGLQNRSSRPYFKNAIGLSPGAIYISGLELNVRNDVVEEPFRPTLRVSTSIYENQICSGVIAINYRASRLFERLAALGERQGLRVYLVNKAGYWLEGPTPEESWAWQRDAPQMALAHTNPALWKAINKVKSGRHSDASGDWAFTHLELDETTSVDRAYPAPLVSELGVAVLVHGSPELAAQSTWRWKSALVALMAVVLFFAVNYGSQTLNSLLDEDRQARELQAANLALSQANEDLHSVQADLARAERLSSLGLMVAGVAHELNTPLGSASLSLSTLQQSISTLLARLDSGLRRSDLDSFVINARLATELAQAAVQRAAGLVQRFKQVAVDRTTMERREFDLADIILDADPRLRKWDVGQAVSLRLDLMPGVRMSSYPGPLEQVVANLLGNALAHAFRGRAKGTITIQAADDGPDHVVVRISDDGVGIDGSHLGRIFDPFFTTSRHAGGTGLGLHIVSQLVNEVLGGTIQAENVAPEHGTGAVFTLRLPRDAPEQHAPSNPAA